MAIYEFLSNVQDERKGSHDCEFNGYLEDYLDLIGEDAKHYDLFKRLSEVNSSAKIIVSFRVGINKETISNQIIRYKDIFKLKENPLVCPYIIYAEVDDSDKALLLTDDHFLYVKGLYYTMTEPNGLLQDMKNEIIAMTMKDESYVISIFERLFNEKSGTLQREIDRRNYSNYDMAKEDALKLSNEMDETAFAQIADAPLEKREDLINSFIIRWFLLKKYLYVQYMINKDILVKNHEGNVKRQRNQAKINADEVKFISLSDMWRSCQNDDKEDAE